MPGWRLPTTPPSKRKTHNSIKLPLLLLPNSHTTHVHPHSTSTKIPIKNPPKAFTKMFDPSAIKIFFLFLLFCACVVVTIVTLCTEHARLAKIPATIAKKCTLHRTQHVQHLDSEHHHLRVHNGDFHLDLFHSQRLSAGVPNASIGIDNGRNRRNVPMSTLDHAVPSLFSLFSENPDLETGLGESGVRAPPVCRLAPTEGPLMEMDELDLGPPEYEMPTYAPPAYERREAALTPWASRPEVEETRMPLPAYSRK